MMTIFKDFDKFSNNIACINDEGLSITYGNLKKEADNLYRVIGRRGLVFSLCSNSIGSFVGYFSFLSNFLVPLMLDAKLDAQLLKDLIAKYSPSYLWIPVSKSIEFPLFEPIIEIHNYILLKNPKSIDYPIASNLAMLLTTSGSTGSPKLVRISYQNILSNAESISAYLNIKQTDRPITTLPMHYSFGISILNSHVLIGATILLTSRSIIEKEFWKFLKQERATSLSGVPYTFEVLKKIRFFNMDLPYLKILTQAGGRLNIDLKRDYIYFCQKTGRKFIVMYGQTEATARMSYLPFEFALSKLGSIGIAIPNGRFELLDEGGNPIDENEVAGELVYSGQNVSLGYAQSTEDLMKGDENFGRLFTGDIAKRDVDGFYYIIGRKNRFIKLFGNRINLDEAEQLLKVIIDECACVGADDLMVIYITDSNRSAEVRNYISKKLGLHHSGFFVKCLDDIPKNSSGKIEYSKLM